MAGLFCLLIPLYRLEHNSTASYFFGVSRGWNWGYGFLGWFGGLTCDFAGVLENFLLRILGEMVRAVWASGVRRGPSRSKYALRMTAETIQITKEKGRQPLRLPPCTRSDSIRRPASP